MKIISLVALALLAAPVAASAQEPPLPADTVARVEQTPILKSDFEHWMTVAARSSGAKEVPAPGGDDYAQLRDQVVQLLVSFAWIRGETKERGITVSDAAVVRSFRKEKRRSFPTDAEYRRFLRTSGQTEGDILQRMKLDLLSNRLRDRIVAGARTDKGKQRLLDRFVARFARKWRKRTVCGVPYKTPDCGRTLPIAP